MARLAASCTWRTWVSAPPMTSRSAWVRWCTTSTRRTRGARSPTQTCSSAATPSTAAARRAPGWPWPSVATRPWATSKRQDLRHLLPAGVPAPFDGPSCDIMDMADVNVCTTTGFTKRVGALAYCVDPESGECKIAYPDLLSGRSSACAIQSSSACRLRSWRSSARFFQDGLNCWLRS